MRQLLIDCTPFNISKQSLLESLNDPNKPFRVQGLLTSANKKNQNDRIYPKAILEREVAKYQQFIQDNRAVGELDHPDSSIIELKNVSHRLIEAHWQGDDLYGTFEILTTPSGNILRELLRNGVTLGVSSRAMGSVTENGDTVMVEDDLELICWDFVSNPSNYGSFVSPINESVDQQRVRVQAVQSTPLCRINILVREILAELN